MKRWAPWLLWTVLVGCTPATTAAPRPQERAVEAEERRAPEAATRQTTPILDGEDEREEESISAYAY